MPAIDVLHGRFLFQVTLLPFSLLENKAIHVHSLCFPVPCSNTSFTPAFELQRRSFLCSSVFLFGI